MAKEGRFGAQNAPESQTLIVPELSPETILPPSLSNATLKTAEPAFVDPISFRDSESKGMGKNGQLWPSRGEFGPNPHLHPRL